MQLRHLRYFIAVAEEGSVLRAARRLHVAQPSVSRQIQDLEREVGCQLFERMARGVRLTAAGEAFFLEARNTVENAARAVESARNAQDKAASRFVFGAGRLTSYPGLLTDILTDFRAFFRDCDLQVRTLNDEQQKAALRDSSISAAVSWMAEAPSSEFASHALITTALRGVLLPDAHPLSRQQTISLNQLQTMTRLHHPRRSAPELYRSLRIALMSRGLDPIRHRAVPVDVTTVEMHIAAGDAYILCSDLTASARGHVNNGVVYRRFVEPPIPLSLSMFWRAEDTSRQLQGLIDIATRVNPVQEAVA